jgi:high affinity Mn2+ porin
MFLNTKNRAPFRKVDQTRPRFFQSFKTVFAAVWACAFFVGPSHAQQTVSTPSPVLLPLDSKDPTPSSVTAPTNAEGATENWAIHGDAIEVLEGQPGFHDPYNGTNSLRSTDNFRQTSTADLFFDIRLWPGAELYVNPEYYQGFGLGLTHGIAEFPNAQAYKVGNYRGVTILPNVFIRQTFGFGGEQEHLDSGPLQLAENVDISRLTITVGKMAIINQFDNNTYSHDPSSQFLNWTLVDAGAFDYAADSYGFEQGLTVELNQKWWAARAGYFTVPRYNNGLATDGHYLNAFQLIGELEGRYQLFGHPGKVRLTGWLLHQHLGDYASLFQQQNILVNGARSPYHTDHGLILGFEQEITKDVGAFARLSYRDPRLEAYMFTDIDRSASLGISVNGQRWQRPNDVFGAATGVADIGVAHRAYYNEGGLGILVGDGKLPHFGYENFTEIFYNLAVYKMLSLTADYQLFFNPGYNTDKGPINVFSGRITFRF